MAQTQNAISWKNCEIEISTDAATWKDISGFSNSIKVDGGERAIGEFFTVDGDTPILTAGKRSSLTITISAVYTEDAADAPYIMAQTAYEAESALYVQWSPNGGGVGDQQFTSSRGHVTQPVYPAGAADSGDPIVIEIVVAVASISKATIT